MDRSRFIVRRNEGTADAGLLNTLLWWGHGGGTYRLAPIWRAGLVIAVGLTSALTNHRALANWYGQYIGPGTCTPLDHINIGSDGAVTVIHDLGKLRTPEDFSNSLKRLGFEFKPQKIADNTIQIYSATMGPHAVNFTFKFFTDQKACLADADASLGLPSGLATAGVPAPAPQPSASLRTQQSVAMPPQPAVPAPTAAAPIPPPHQPSQATALPAPAKVWIITVLRGNDPMGAPLSRFYRTKQDCASDMARVEKDPLIQGATGRFRFDCLQLIEADQKAGTPGSARTSARRIHKNHPHPLLPRAAADTPILSNEPPPSERSPPLGR